MRKFCVVQILMFLLVINGSFLQTVQANNIGYAVALIPKEMLKNANMVRRMETIEFNLKSPGEAVFIHKYALTILNAAGDRYSNLVVPYDKFFAIRDISGTLYDATGKQLKKVKNQKPSFKAFWINEEVRERKKMICWICLFKPGTRTRNFRCLMNNSLMKCLFFSSQGMKQRQMH